MSQYFIENPSLLTNERILELEIFGRRYEFLANNGLFSCDKVDDASITLMHNIPPLYGSLLDLGCGYGPIGIVLAKTYGVELTMSDINSIALGYATKNAKRNNIHTTAIHSDAFANITGMFDTIVLNPPIHAGKDIMYKMYHEAAQHLTHGGEFYIVIQKKHGAESTIKKLNDIFAQVKVVYKKKGCYVVCCTT